MHHLIFLVFTLFWWALFVFCFVRDRSRYRNCYLLFLALLSLMPLAISLSGEHVAWGLIVFADAILLAILIVPFFLMHNGVVMLRREGRHLSHMLSLVLGAVILVGEVVTLVVVLSSAYPASAAMSTQTPPCPSVLYVIGALVSVSIIYGSMSFLIFMIYTLFLQIIPIKRDFDYVIVHGAGLSGERPTKLLRDRLDKAVQVYRRDPTPPKIIPSGGKGADEQISEAEARKRYLIEQGIPEEDIILEDTSTTTLENLKNSKRILDGLEGRKYTALVTSNYHVYRALRYCRKIGLKCTGIGSRVAFYYWPSALIREFIAIHAEKKHAVLFVLGWALCVALILIGVYA